MIQMNKYVSWNHRLKFQRLKELTSCQLQGAVSFSTWRGVLTIQQLATGRVHAISAASLTSTMGIKGVPAIKIIKSIISTYIFIDVYYYTFRFGAGAIEGETDRLCESSVIGSYFQRFSDLRGTMLERASLEGCRHLRDIGALSSCIALQSLNLSSAGIVSRVGWLVCQ